MSTPTTVKLQIAVPSTNGGAEKVYNLTLSLLVEECTVGEIRVAPVLTGESNLPEGENEIPDGVVPSGSVPLIQDPPKPN